MAENITPRIETDEQIFRRVLRQYHIEDAKAHVLEELESYDIDRDRITIKDTTDEIFIDADDDGESLLWFDLECLAEEFEDKHDCEIADNVTWDNVISEYIESDKHLKAFFDELNSTTTDEED